MARGQSSAAYPRAPSISRRNGVLGNQARGGNPLLPRVPTAHWRAYAGGLVVLTDRLIAGCPKVPSTSRMKSDSHKRRYCSETTQAVDDAVAAMHAHGGSGCSIESFEDQHRLVFGWRCTCGEEWCFRLMSFKISGMRSKWRKEMTTSDGRRKLIGQAHGCVVVHGERRL